MGTATFTRNQLVRIDGKDCRLLRRVDDDTAWLMEEVQTGRNRTLTDSERNCLYREGKLTLIVPGLNDRVVGKTLADGLNEKNRKWEMAKVRRAFVLVLESMSASEEERKTAVLELWEKIGRPQTKKCSPHRTPKPPTLKAISEWRKRFISGGRDTLSLIERTANCGNRARRMPEIGLRIIREAIDEVYLTRERPPLKAAVEEATARIHAENSQRPAGDQIPTPSYKLVRNTLLSDYYQFDIDVCRYGREEATKRYRRVCKHHDGLKPNVVWQVDHTVVDAIAIDDQSGLPLGRPCIAIAIDVGSRMIMGIYISFYPPCQLTLYGCLKEAILPKDWVREKYPDIENDWPAVGLPDEILVDRAMENFANGLLSGLGMTGVTPRQAPRKMPWLKPFVERVNGTIERDLIHQIPGTTFSNVLEKMGYEPSKHAVVKYSLLRKVIYRWIIDVYHQTFHRTLQTSPVEQWKLGIRPEEIRFPSSAAGLSATLGRRVERVLTHKGIELENLLYSSADLQDIRLKHGQKVPVTVSVDDGNLGAVVVFKPDSNEPVTVPAIRKEYAEGLTLDQHRAIRDYVRKQYPQLNILNLIKAKAAIRKEIQAAMWDPSLKTRKRTARMAQGALMEERKALDGEFEVISQQSAGGVEQPVESGSRPAKTLKGGRSLRAANGRAVTSTQEAPPPFPTPESIAAPTLPLDSYQPIRIKRVG